MFNDRVAAGIFDEKGECGNGTIPAGEEVVLMDSGPFWKESFLYALWNGTKIGLAAYYMEPLKR